MALSSAINDATDDFLVACDWEKNFYVCSLITDDKSAQLFTELLKKRLQQKSNRTKSRSIELLQTGMQNNYWIVRNVHSPPFQRFLMDLINNNLLELYDKNHLLNLIRSWGEAFRPGYIHKGYPNYYKTFEFLQSKHNFPGRDDNSNYHPPSPPSSSSNHIEKKSNLSSIFNKIDPSNPIYKVGTQINERLEQQKLIIEMLHAVNSREENVCEMTLLNDMINQCKQYQKDIHSIIERVTNDDLLMLFIQFNDKIEEIQTIYSDLEISYKNRDSNPPTSLNTSNSFGGLNSPVTLNIGISSYSSSDNNTNQIQGKNEDKSINNNEEEEDEYDEMFDMLANRNNSNINQESSNEQSSNVSIDDIFNFNPSRPSNNIWFNN